LLAADGLTLNYNIYHPECSERGTEVKSIERKQMSSEPRTYLAKLKNRFSVAERTTAFQFEKPTNFIFRPGQWIDITLLNPAETDAEGNVRGFSIASAPYEHTLMVATRMRDTAFKRELAKVPLNTEVKIVGPGGNLTLHNNPARTAVFFAGGIGVTPIRSIVFHAAKQRLPHRIFFFFSNRRPEDAPFLADLHAAKRKSKLHMHPHHDRYGEITPPVERGNGLHQQRDAGEIPRCGKISDLLHRRAAENG
jgi:ferredoxin-NADP reductase